MSRYVDKLIDDILGESSLSRLKRNRDDYDSGILTAYRGGNTNRENRLRNKNLLKSLRDKGYGVTKVGGMYQEDGMDEPAQERSFFVTNRNNSRRFKKDLMDLGNEYEQDSILYSPKGSKSKLIRTTRNRGKLTTPASKTVWGKKSPNSPAFTKYRSRPFADEIDPGDFFD